MTINCVWEHNGRDTLLYAVDFVGAYTRGETLEAAVRKMQAEICSYLKWCGKKAVTSMDIAIIEEKVSELAICDADSDVLFESEKAPVTTHNSCQNGHIHQNTPGKPELSKVLPR